MERRCSPHERSGAVALFVTTAETIAAAWAAEVEAYDQPSRFWTSEVVEGPAEVYALTRRSSAKAGVD